MMLELTTGTLILLGGIGVLIVTMICSVLSVTTAGKRKMKMEERMKEKY